MTDEFRFWVVSAHPGHAGLHNIMNTIITGDEDLGVDGMTILE